MDKIRTSVIAVVFVLVVWQPVSAQQRHVADQATLDQVVADHVRQSVDDREAIRRVLENEQVRKLAEGVGLDLKRAETAVATLDEDTLAVIGAQAHAASDALSGGQSTVTISTTAIIIGLLILILLVVAV